ncbi:MAG: hypothetical protein OXD40_07440 [bacterium]|nr:hypothetical protein [bacterium]
MALAEAADDEAEVDIPAKLKRHEDRREASRAAKAEIEARAATRHEEEEKAWREKRRGRKGGGKPPSPLQPGSRDIRVDPFADLALARERDVSADLRQAFLFFAREGKLRSGAVLFDDRGEQVLVVMTGPTGEGRMPGAGKQLKGGMEHTPV